MQLRERRDFQQLKASEVFGAAKKMPGQQPAQVGRAGGCVLFGLHTA